MKVLHMNALGVRITYMQVPVEVQKATVYMLVRVSHGKENHCVEVA